MATRCKGRGKLKTPIKNKKGSIRMCKRPKCKGRGRLKKSSRRGPRI